MNKTQSLKKIGIAIDKMIELQEDGYACDSITRILEMLNALYTKLLMN